MQAISALLGRGAGQAENGGGLDLGALSQFLGGREQGVAAASQGGTYSMITMMALRALLNNQMGATSKPMTSTPVGPIIPQGIFNYIELKYY